MAKRRETPEAGNSPPGYRYDEHLGMHVVDAPCGPATPPVAAVPMTPQDEPPTPTTAEAVNEDG